MKAKILLLTIAAAFAVVSCDFLGKSKYFVDRNFDNELAAYAWKHSEGLLCFDIEKSSVFVDFDGKRSAYSQFIIDWATDMPSENEVMYMLKCHNPLPTDSTEYTFMLSLTNFGRDTVMYYRLIKDNDWHNAYVTLKKACPLSEYEPVFYPTYVDYVIIGGKTFYTTPVSRMYDSNWDDTTIERARRFKDHEGVYEFELAGLGKPEDFAGRDFSGKYACVDRGEISFDEKWANASRVGAIGLIIINYEEDDITPLFTDEDVLGLGFPKSAGDYFKNPANTTFQIGCLEY